MPSNDDTAETVLANESALHCDAVDESENHSQGLSTLLHLCQASLEAIPQNSKNQIPSDASISMWTKHFSLQDLTSASAGHSIFSPHTGPYPGDGPAASSLPDRDIGFRVQLQLPGSILPPRSDLSNSGLASDCTISAVKRGRITSEEADDTETVTCDDSFMRRLSKIRPLSILTAKTDNSGNSSGHVRSGHLISTHPSLFKRSLKSSSLISSDSQNSRRQYSLVAGTVADIHVPSICECGSVVVGVWYRNRPFYTRWFRHPRYAALRFVLEHNRCKSKPLPLCGTSASSVPEDVGALKAGVPGVSDSYQQSSSCPTSSQAASGEITSASSAVSHDGYGAITSPEELLAPKSMSLLCLLQFVKNLDVSAIPDSSTAPVGASPCSMSFDHVKLGAHVDCNRGEEFALHRWYAADADALFKDITSHDAKTKKCVVGCCCMNHWRNKTPGCKSSKSSSRLLVQAALDIQNVCSPIDLEDPRIDALDGAPNVAVDDWKSLDHSVWQACKSLLLLPPEVIEAAMKIPFTREEPVAHEGSMCCGRHCHCDGDEDKQKSGIVELHSLPTDASTGERPEFEECAGTDIRE